MSMELSCCKLIINKNNGLLGSILTFTSRSSASVFDIRRPSRQNRKRYFQRNTRISLFKGLSIFRDILKHIYFLFSLLYFLKKFSNQTKNRKYFSAFAPGVFFRTKWNSCRKKIFQLLEKQYMVWILITRTYWYSFPGKHFILFFTKILSIGDTSSLIITAEETARVTFNFFLRNFTSLLRSLISHFSTL